MVVVDALAAEQQAGDHVGAAAAAGGSHCPIMVVVAVLVTGCKVGGLWLLLLIGLVGQLAKVRGSVAGSTVDIHSITTITAASGIYGC